MASLFDDYAGATLSPCRIFRYRLWRTWNDGPPVNFIMLNPSTADELLDDPTIRRCIGYARAWDYSGIVVTNLFALRATDPDDLRYHPAPVGPGNDTELRAAARDAGLVVCAWGSHGGIQGRAATVERILRSEGVRLHYLRRNKDGRPAHPLYLPGSLTPQVWAPPRTTGPTPPTAR